MKDIDFANDIIERHPRTAQTVLKDIKAFLVGFTEEQIEKLHGLYVSSEFSAFPPRGLSGFESLAKENGITKKSEGKKFVYFWRCDACNTAYSFISRGCPKCYDFAQKKPIKTSARVQYSERPPSSLVKVHDGCWSCREYHSGFRPMGPSCVQYGQIDNGVKKEGEEPAPSMCRGCRCASCCAQEFRSRNKQHRELNALTGKTYHEVEDIAKRF